MVITEPQADAVVGSPLRIDGTNGTMSDGVVLRVYPEGEAAAIYEGAVTGGGVFVLGDFSADN